MESRRDAWRGDGRDDRRLDRAFDHSEFLSPEFLDCVGKLCAAAKQRGFKLAFNLGIDGLPRGWLGHLTMALKSGHYGFTNLLLLEGLDTETEASQLVDLLEQDASVTVACLHSLPESWACFPGSGVPALRAKLQKAIESGRILDLRGASWQEALSKLQSVYWNPANTRLQYQHRCVKGGDAYFLMNDGDATFDGEVSFPQSSPSPEIWNAETGEVSSAPQYRRDLGKTWVKLTIKPYDSAVVTFSGSRERLHATEATGCDVRFDAEGHLVMT